jgi:carboxymethylenebutenolidase
MTINVKTRIVTLTARNGQPFDAFVAEPDGGGPYPGIAFGAEAMGPNRFNRTTASRLAALGYVTITPDYYRGSGPSQPDNYDDFTEVLAAIDALDFGNATSDLLTGIDWLRGQPNVCADKIGLWGYCTGGTLAMLASALDRHLKATVIFFLSQPCFPEITAKRPVNAWDMIWAITSPVLLISGGDDPILPPERIAELRRRFELWNVEHQIEVYPGAAHAFTGDAPNRHHAAATAASWEVATRFLADAMARPLVV